MTVSYQYDVASSTSGGFIRLLFRWRGSVWKLVYKELFFFTGTYVSLALLYRFIFTEFQKRVFERIVFFCSTFMDLIPLSFVLGFYVSFIATRWWNQYTAIPWPDKLMNSIALYIPGVDETSRVLRRTLMRYLNVALVLVLRSISMAVKRRFPTRDHLVEAGFMTKQELEMLQSVPSTEFNTFWIPCTWFINLLRESKQECRITDSNGLKLIMEEFNEFRSKCGLLWSYDWISIPLVYTQVVTLATYAFFGACIFGRQYTESEQNPAHRFEYYIPVFTIFQLFFYMGLLKVAEQLINPFGDDDEDFELNWIIDRHFKVSYLGVDLLNTSPPPLVRDNYFYQLDMKLPYTEASVGYKKKTYRGSVARMQIPQEKQTLLVPEFCEDDDEDRIAATLGMGNRGASLWTLVGGKLVTRFSVSNQNLDTITLESGSNNWRVSNPSLFMPDSTMIPDGKASTGSWGTNPNFQIAEEGDVPPESAETEISQPRRPSDHGKKALAKKLVKKVPPIRVPHLKRKGHHHHPPNRWVTFQSTPNRENEEALSLHGTAAYATDTTDPGYEDGTQIPSKSSFALEPNTSQLPRRQSFDERSINMVNGRPWSRFQSLPDVQGFAVQAGVVPEEWEGDQDAKAEGDNLSTTNLLILEEDSEPEEEHMHEPPLPHLIVTGASRSPSPMPSSTEDDQQSPHASSREDSDRGVFYLPSSDTETQTQDKR